MNDNDIPRLPDKLSDLIRVAVKDARTLDREKYFPNALSWHDPNYLQQSCSVCDAGAVLARTFNWPIDQCSTQNFDGLGEHNGQRLFALNALRVGHIARALEDIGSPEFNRVDLWNLPQPTYQLYQGWRQFENHLQSMERLADGLEKLGL